MFQYKLKTGPNGETVKCKARLCARGDLQFESEYGDTFAPTSRFSMIRLILVIAVQAGLMLYQFDIKGVFLCAPIDREIYLKLPPGYEPPPGKTARLRRGDRVTFLYSEGTSVILLSIYVNDGIAACNNRELYQQFFKDLGKDFELSNQGPVN
eukprot:181289-Rhodomonas_salina.1